VLTRPWNLGRSSGPDCGGLWICISLSWTAWKEIGGMKAGLIRCMAYEHDSYSNLVLFVWLDFTANAACV
jgi:hypothetical protein